MKGLQTDDGQGDKESSLEFNSGEQKKNDNNNIKGCIIFQLVENM